jgi:hypothetical protein
MAVETIELTEAIWKTAKRLEGGANAITKKAKEYATAEKEYRIALSKEIMRLKTQSMSVTLIPDLARGNTAELKFKRDLAAETYKSSKIMLDALSNELSAMQSILKIQERIESN